MSGRNLLLIAAAAIVAALAVVAAVLLTPSQDSETTPAPPADAADGRPGGAAAGAGGVDQQLEMVVFFQSLQRHDLLVPVTRSVDNFISLDWQAKQLLEKLVEGPAQSEGLAGTVPEGTRLARFYLDERGTAYLVFNRALTAGHEGGTTGELMTVYSIVNTLCVNFPTVQRVRILIEGADSGATPPSRRGTLAGHIDLSRPLTLDSEYFAPGYPARRPPDGLPPGQGEGPAGGA